MDKKLNIYIIIIVFFAISVACNKDQNKESCSAISIIGTEDLYVGTWQWDSTLIEKWYDIGPSDYYCYTPQTEGINYSISLENKGIYRTYQNGVLTNAKMISEVTSEGSNSTVDFLYLILNCDNTSELHFWHDINDLSDSLIILFQYPFDFSDEANKVRSVYNYFSKQ